MNKDFEEFLKGDIVFSGKSKDFVLYLIQKYVPISEVVNLLNLLISEVEGEKNV
jgi:hypothetical protein